MHVNTNVLIISHNFEYQLLYPKIMLSMFDFHATQNVLHLILQKVRQWWMDNYNLKWKRDLCKDLKIFLNYNRWWHSNKSIIFFFLRQILTSRWTFSPLEVLRKRGKNVSNFRATMTILREFEVKSVGILHFTNIVNFVKFLTT